MYKMQRLEVSGAVQPLQSSLGVNGLILKETNYDNQEIRILAAEATVHKIHRHVVFHIC